jgi:hypothetical protein
MDEIMQIDIINVQENFDVDEISFLAGLHYMDANTIIENVLL